MVEVGEGGEGRGGGGKQGEGALHRLTCRRIFFVVVVALRAINTQ